jgi:formylmethanofuran dehydrogenase subunit B
MRRAIVDARAAHTAELAALRTRIAANRDALAAHALANDRTWPFPLASS